MRKILYLLCIAFLMLQSCSNEGSEESPSSSPSNAQLVGKWSYFKGREFPAGTNITGKEELYLADHECSTQKDYIEFRQDGTLKSFYYDSECHDFGYSGTWTLSSFDLTIKAFGEDSSYEILEINSTTLKIKNNIKDSKESITVSMFKKG